MSKRELPKHVYLKKGGIYFQRRGWATVRFQNQPGTVEFFAEYTAILRGRGPVPEGKTLKALAISYQRSDRFTALAPRTRADYLHVLDYIKDKLGHLPADRMQRKDVIRAQDSNRDAVRFANYIVQVLSVMFEHAIDQGWCTDNPARGVRKLKSNQPPACHGRKTRSTHSGMPHRSAPGRDWCLNFALAPGSASATFSRCAGTILTATE